MLGILAQRKVRVLSISALVFLMSACFSDLSLAIDESIRQASIHTSSINNEKLKQTKPHANRSEAISFYKMGNRDFDEKYYDEAIANYRRAIEIEPTFTPAYYNLGMVHLAMGLRKEAAGYLHTFLNLRPNAINADEIRLLIQSLHQ